jgi:uncharacterized membrane protein
MNTIQEFLKKPYLYAVIIVVGALLKMYNLNSKLFWEDEVSTVLYTSGQKGSAIKKSIPVNQIKSVRFYDSLLHPSRKGSTITGEISGILSDTHLTPAHYVFLTLWYRIVGDENINYRWFSVFVFIISLPFTFLFSKTLFNSALAGWIGTSLYAVSPFIHFESQEARYYILWAFFFILCNYLFLQAIKLNRFAWWIGYSLACILALYTSALSAFLIIGHLIYLLLFKKELLMRFSVFLLFIFLAYLPWMYFLYTVRDTIEKGLAWHKMGQPTMFTLVLLISQFVGMVRSFTFLQNGLPYKSLIAIVTDLAVFAFIIYAFVYAFKSSAKTIRWYLMLIVLPLFLLFYISDIIRGAFASFLIRYQIVNMVAISLIITNLLCDKIYKGRLLFVGAYLGLVILGVASILKIGANRCWNTRPDCGSNVEEAQLISSASQPLLLTDFGGWGFPNFLAVINESKAKNSGIIYCKGEIPDIIELIKGKSYSDIFIMQASDKLAEKLKGQFGERMLAQKQQPNPMSPQIWRIKLKE